MKLPTILLLACCLGLGGTIYLRAQDPAGTGTDARTNYYVSGKIESRVEFEGDKRHGLAERWHTNGQKLSEGRYEHGRMEGDWRFWNADGSPDAERSGTYVDGQRVEGAAHARLRGAGDADTENDA